MNPHVRLLVGLMVGLSCHKRAQSFTSMLAKSQPLLLSRKEQLVKFLQLLEENPQVFAEALAKVQGIFSDSGVNHKY